MTILENSILTFIEFLIWMLLISKALGEDIRKFLKYILIYAPIYLLIENSRTDTNTLFILLVYHASMMSFIKITFKKIWSMSVVIHIYTAIFAFSIQWLSTTIFATILKFVFASEIQYMFTHGIISMSIAMVIAVLLYLLAPLYKGTEALHERKEVLYMVGVVFLSIQVVWYYSKQLDRSTAINSSFIFSILCIMLIAIGYLTVKMIIELKEKNEALKRYDEYDSLIAEIKDQTHDFAKHLQALYSLVLLSGDTKTSEYIEEYMSELKESSINPELLKLERKALVGYLYIKMTQLKNAGINCRIDINNYAMQSKIKDYKLVEALGILIENAWEASDKDNNDVRIEIKEESGKTVVEVLNKHEPIRTPDNMYKRGYSTKGDNRGFGLYNLSKLAKENRCKPVFENREIEGENFVCIGLII